MRPDIARGEDQQHGKPMAHERRTSYRAMEGLPTVELRCPSRLLCSIPPPPLPGSALYGASRAFIHSLAGGLAEELAPRGVKLGLTVDPVKIDSLEQFGTLATVTDRVLTVEEGRDGVTDVKALSTSSGRRGPSDTAFSP